MQRADNAKLLLHVLSCFKCSSLGVNDGGDLVSDIANELDTWMPSSCAAQADKLTGVD